MYTNISTTTTRRRRWAALLGAALILAVLASCPSDTGAGYCESPTPCGSNHGANP